MRRGREAGVGRRCHGPASLSPLRVCSSPTVFASLQSAFDLGRFSNCQLAAPPTSSQGAPKEIAGDTTGDALGQRRRQRGRRDLLPPADLMVGQVLMVDDLQIAACPADAPCAGDGDVDPVGVDVADIEGRPRALSMSTVSGPVGMSGTRRSVAARRK